MSYKNDLKRVLNSQDSLNLRNLNLKHCIEQYCWLTHRSFIKTFRRLGEYCQFDCEELLTEEQIFCAVTLLDKDRNDFLKKLAEFEKIRVIQKRQGQRQPSKKAVRALYESRESNANRKKQT